MKITFKKQILIFSASVGLVLAIPPTLKADTTLTGAGASFPFPIYSKWFSEYHKRHPEVKINYQSIGSGGGVRQILHRTVDFGASDGPLSDKKLFKVKGKLHHIPTVLGGVVAVFNLDGVNDLNLEGDTLADIFLGKITKWNDDAIQSANPGVELPGTSITVIHRSDGSGTTYAFSDYLAKVSSDWKIKVGQGQSLNWPVGLGGKGNEGVSGLILQTRNSIGYAGFIYASQTHLSHVAIKNKNGNYIKASVESIGAAAAGAAAQMPEDFRVSISNAPGDQAYPISTFTWLLVYDRTPGKKGKVLKEFLTWMLGEGQEFAPPLGYAPLPENVKKMVGKTVSSLK